MYGWPGGNRIFQCGGETGGHADRTTGGIISRKMNIDERRVRMNIIKRLFLIGL